MTKIEALLIIYLRFYAKRYNGNYYEVKPSDYLLYLLKLLEIGWTKCKTKKHKICFMYEIDCTEIPESIITLSASANNEVCRMILSVNKDLFARSEKEMHIIHAMFVRMGYNIRFTNQLKFVAIGNM